VTIPALTNSEMSQFLNCRRGWWLSYYRGLRLKDHAPSKAIIVGSLFHSGLELFYRGEEPDVVVEHVRALVEKLLNDYPGDRDIADAVEVALIILEGYFPWVAEGHDADYVVLGSEQTVEVKLPDTPFRLRGKIDAPIRREADGAKLQLEHKTVGNFTDLPRIAQSHPQFLTYDLLAHLKERQDGGEVRTDGVLLNMAKRVKQTSRAKPPFYARHVVRHNLDELRAHFRHVVSVGHDIEQVRAALDGGHEHHDICPPRITRDHTWSCPCSGVTQMFDDGSDVEGFLAEFYETYDPWERYEEKGEE
jgi:hypothetical protein